MCIWIIVNTVTVLYLCLFFLLCPFLPASTRHIRYNHFVNLTIHDKQVTSNQYLQYHQPYPTEYTLQGKSTVLHHHINATKVCWYNFFSLSCSCMCVWFFFACVWFSSRVYFNATWEKPQLMTELDKHVARSSNHFSPLVHEVWTHKSPVLNCTVQSPHNKIPVYRNCSGLMRSPMQSLPISVTWNSMMEEYEKRLCERYAKCSEVADPCYWQPKETTDL